MTTRTPLIEASELVTLLRVKQGELTQGESKQSSGQRPIQQPVVIDASWHLPNVQRNAYEEYVERHIPGALFFDIDTIADTDSDLPHMLPSEAVFAEKVGALGIGANSPVVVYDSYGLFSAARVWWMFKVFSHQQVRLLSGGLPGWVAAGNEVEAGVVEPVQPDSPFNAALNRSEVCDCDEVKASVENQSACILDARPKARFDGAIPEPRKGLRSGHMPGARSLPFTDLLHSDEAGVMRLKPPEQLSAILKASGVEDGTPVITTCGSGVTAAVITLALEVVGMPAGRLYDGSWTEWGGRDDTPIE